jgi:hypothetical protein
LLARSDHSFKTQMADIIRLVAGDRLPSSSPTRAIGSWKSPPRAAMAVIVDFIEKKMSFHAREVRILDSDSMCLSPGFGA